MATQKPISTISYNTEPFLQERLKALYDAHIIQAWQYICHKGEDGDKDHIHLRIEPNKKLDPMDLIEQFREYQFGKEKPLCCRPFRSSKEEDWFLYAVHDADYLRLKYGGGDSHEKMPYDWRNIVCSEFYDLEVAFTRAKSSLKHTSVNIATRLRSGEQPADILLDGENPFAINQVHHLLQTSEYVSLQRDFSLLQDQYHSLLSALDAKHLVVSWNPDGSCSIDDPLDSLLS